MRTRLVLKDGTEIMGGRASRSSNNELMIRIPGNTILESAAMFSDPEKTGTIIGYESIYKRTYIGFTDMYTIQYFIDENYTELWLKPPKDGTTSFNKEFTVPEIYIPEEVNNNA